MCGCLIGTLSQVPQQNVFLGLPLQLMVEEAALLVEKGISFAKSRQYPASETDMYFVGAAYIVDDVAAHKLGRGAIDAADKQDYLAERDLELRALAEENQREAIARKVAALEKKGLTNLLSRSSTPSSSRNKKTGTIFSSSENKLDNESPSVGEDEGEDGNAEETETNNTSLFSQTASHSNTSKNEDTSVTFHSTATTSHQVYHLIPTNTTTPNHLIPKPDSNRYPLYRHLHSKGYFLSPGLRFGAQYMAYPGDPLRFHSHFVVNGIGWDEEISVMDIVGGGRLGTGVKKAWMVGGRDPGWKDGEGDGEEVRVFSVEWGGF